MKFTTGKQLTCENFRNPAPDRNEGELMIGDNIRALREDAGLSQTQLAEKLHVVRQTVSKWEQGKSVPDAQMCKAIANALSIPVADLFSEKETARDHDDMIIQLGLINEKLQQQNESRSAWEGVISRTIAVFLSMPLVAWLLAAFTSCTQ